MKRWLIGIAVVGVVVLGALFAGLRAAFYFPAAQERAPVACPLDAPLLAPGEPVKVLVWNIQYGASREFNFFYDGGPTVSVPPITAERTTEAIGAYIAAQQPDIVLLQEVDRDSRRTGHLDEHALLREIIGLPCHSAVPYHRAPYVPAPSHEPLGRVDMNLSVFSRFQIDSATRHQLALLAESPVRRIFNLRRAVHELQFPLQGGGSLALFNTHLSAFSRNDGTLEKQIGQLGELADGAGERWLLAGDLNALPPGDDPSRIPDGPTFYGGVSGVAPLFERYASPFPPRDEPSLRTYVPWEGDEPDRTLDYVFHGGGVQVSDLTVDRTTYPLSDHLPLVFTLTVSPQ